MFQDAGMALEEAGMLDVANALRKVGSLDERHDIRKAVTVLDGLGPELVKAYVRAGKFIEQAPMSVRPDAVKYQRDLFTARCYVSAVRAAAKQTLRGDYMLN
jgi:hypothetical protein